MCKVQAFCLLVLTLFVFSQASPVQTHSRFALLAAHRDVQLLKGIVKANNFWFLIPSDVPNNCSLNALACFGGMMVELNKQTSHGDTVSNIISDVITNIQQIMETKLKKEVTKWDLCFNKQCTFKMVRKDTRAVLYDLSDFLKRMNTEQ